MDHFKKLAKIYKQEFPEYQIYIRRVKLPEGLPGDCLKISKNKFRIRINKLCTIDEQLLWLCHEVSHCLSYDNPDDHGIAFGKSYAKCYKIYEKFCKED